MKNLLTEKHQIAQSQVAKLAAIAPQLDHLVHSTTPLGVVQHMLEKQHDLRFGYSIDDQARALIICIWYAALYGPDKVSDLAHIYFDYLRDAQLPDGRFHNFRDADGRFIDEDGGDDSFGRSVWVLGWILAHKDYFGLHAAARGLYERARSALQPEHLWLRSLAYASLGLRLEEDRSTQEALINELVKRFLENSDNEWPWFEGNLRYANGILPYALLAASGQSGHEKGLVALNFLNQVSRIDGVPVPIGNQGWHMRNGHRAIYDQQCLEALDMILANAAAYFRFGNEQYKGEVADWFAWFWGLNTNGVTLVTDDGGCYDGLGEGTYNVNQGAESTIAYLMSHLAYVAVSREDATLLVELNEKAR